MDQTLIGLLALGLGFGILHAFDADHIVAVSSLSNLQPAGDKGGGWRRGLAYGMRWAMGHGGILLLVALAASVFQQRLPEVVPFIAEKVVGIVLILSGLAIFRSLYRQRTRLHMHRHGDVLHAHLTTENRRRHHDHRPVLVGVVHGLAGSAPALALIPASFHQPLLSFGYVLLFSTGVLAGMGGFSLLLAHGQRLIQRESQRLYDGSRLLLGSTAVGLGLFWLASA